jgi:hypothetical protein
VKLDGVAVFVTVSCGCSNVVVTELVLLPGVGSVVPAGGLAVALFVIVVPLVGAVAFTVNVTVAPLASVVIVLVTVVAPTVTVPHVAVPVVTAQLAVTPVRPAGSVSVNVVALAALGPLLCTVTV